MINHLYIHIPFCNKICYYCDFCKKFAHNQNIDKYLDYLDKEFSLYISKKHKINTIYIGGGTPSLLDDDQLIKLFNIINKYVYFESDCEITFECNPEDVSLNKVTLLKELKVNRLSIGVQTINTDILNKLNRNHTKNDIINALNNASKYFDNISLDFMFDLPNETINDIKNNIDFIKDNQNKINHISYYSLILENNTVLGNSNYIVDERISSEKYYLILNSLKNIGFDQYEISNFSKNNKSNHNIAYWEQKNYYGIGLGASGFISDLRYTNTASLKDYYNKLDLKIRPISSKEKISNSDKNEELILLNLRMRKGINYDLFKSMNLKLNDNLFLENNRVIIKESKQHISNDIIVDLLIELENND